VIPRAVRSEEELVASAKAGDAGAFDVLVRRHTGQMYRVALRMVGNPMDAEDVVQDAWISAWRNLGGFRGDSALSTWLCRLVTNTALRHLRRPRRTVSLEALVEHIGQGGHRQAAFPAELSSDNRANPEMVTLRNERVATVLRAIATLEPSQRVPLVLRELEEMSYEEVAAVLGITVTALHSRLYRARVALLAKLKELR
jgi:RNA polymerase sigma-70 factor (ECF subfamily)